MWHRFRARYSTQAAILLFLVVSVGCRSVKHDGVKDLLGTTTSSIAPAEEFAPLPSDRELCIQTASTVAERGHVAEAILLYEKAERVAPDQPALDRELAPLYARAGAYDKSVQRYRDLIETHSGDPGVRNNLAWTLIEAGRIPEAIEVAQRGLEINPTDTRLNSTLAVARYRSGDRETAFRLFHAAGGPAAAHHNIALLDIEAGNATSALTELVAATQLPDCSEETHQFLNSLRRRSPSVDDSDVILTSASRSAGAR